MFRAAYVKKLHRVKLKKKAITRYIYWRSYPPTSATRTMRLPACFKLICRRSGATKLTNKNSPTPCRLVPDPRQRYFNWQLGCVSKWSSDSRRSGCSQSAMPQQWHCIVAVVSQSAEYKGQANIQIGVITRLLLWLQRSCMTILATFWRRKETKCTEYSAMISLCQIKSICAWNCRVPSSYRQNTILRRCN